MMTLKKKLLLQILEFLKVILKDMRWIYIFSIKKFYFYIEVSDFKNEKYI